MPVTNDKPGNNPGDKSTDGGFDFDLGSVQKGAMTPKREDDHKSSVTPPVDKNTDDKSTKDVSDKKLDTTVSDKTDDNKDDSGKEPVLETSDEGTAEDKNKVSDDDTPEYVVNEEGDLVDSEGNTVREKGTFEYDEESGEVSFNESAINQIVDKYKEFGIEIKDESGNFVEFEDTPEGHVEFTKSVAKQLAQGVLQAEFDTNPELKKLYYHVKAGGKPVDYYKSQVETPNYENTILKEDDTILSEKVMFDYLTLVNKNDEATAREFIQYHKDSDKLFEKSKDALTKLKDWQVKTETERVAANKEKIRAEVDKVNKYFDDLNETIKSKDLGVINIPDKDVSSFQKYTTERDDRGMTEADQAYQKLSHKERLFLDYMIFKGFKFDEFVKTKALDLRAKKLGKRVTIVPTVKSNKSINRATSVIESDFGVNDIV